MRCLNCGVYNGPERGHCRECGDALPLPQTKGLGAGDVRAVLDQVDRELGALLAPQPETASALGALLVVALGFSAFLVTVGSVLRFDPSGSEVGLSLLDSDLALGGMSVGLWLAIAQPRELMAKLPSSERLLLGAAELAGLTFLAFLVPSATLLRLWVVLVTPAIAIAVTVPAFGWAKLVWAGGREWQIALLSSLWAGGIVSNLLVGRWLPVPVPFVSFATWILRPRGAGGMLVQGRGDLALLLAAILLGAAAWYGSWTARQPLARYNHPA